ncbi:MAG: DUF2970 domain-containing protein [Pseudomonadota bacterium]
MKRVWQVILSGLGALIGVQGSKTYLRDAEQKSPIPYVVVGIVLTLAFIFTLLGVVHWVLRDIH